MTDAVGIAVERKRYFHNAGAELLQRLRYIGFAAFGGDSECGKADGLRLRRKLAEVLEEQPSATKPDVYCGLPPFISAYRPWSMLLQV